MDKEKVYYKFDIKISGDDLKEFLIVTRECFQKRDTKLIRIVGLGLLGIIICLLSGVKIMAYFLTGLVLIYPLFITYMNNMILKRTLSRFDNIDVINQKQKYYSDHVEIELEGRTTNISYEELEYIVKTENNFLLYTKNKVGYLLGKEIVEKKKNFEEFLLSKNKNIKELEV